MKINVSMYLPSNTHLAKEDRVTKTDGERVIMTFAGDKNFTLIEETTDIYDKWNLFQYMVIRFYWRQ